MRNKKSKDLFKLIIIILVGYLGVHKFIEKKTTMGLVYLFTVGLFGIGWIIDIVLAIKELGVIDSSETTYTNNNNTGIKEIRNNKVYRSHEITYKKLSLEEIVERKENEFIVFDTETTGLYPDNGDRIIEFCFLKYKDNVVVDKLMALVNPKCLLPLKIIDITGITDQDLKGKPLMSEYINQIITFINNQIIIGHNVSFDLNFLRSEINKCDFDLEDLSIEYIDTLEMARNTIYLENHKLETLKHYLGIQTTSHRADADCETTYEVYKYCLDMLIENKLQEEKRKERYEKRQQERMLIMSDDEKEIINYFIQVAKKHDKEIKYSFMSDKAISFTLCGIEIGRVKFNGKKRYCRLFAGDSQKHEWENVENPEKQQILDYIDDLFIYVDKEYKRYFLEYGD